MLPIRIQLHTSWSSIMCEDYLLWRVYMYVWVCIYARDTTFSFLYICIYIYMNTCLVTWLLSCWKANICAPFSTCFAGQLNTKFTDVASFLSLPLSVVFLLDLLVKTYWSKKKLAGTFGLHNCCFTRLAHAYHRPLLWWLMLSTYLEQSRASFRAVLAC